MPVESNAESIMPCIASGVQKPVSIVHLNALKSLLMQFRCHPVLSIDNAC